jgi:hypothetical protein
LLEVIASLLWACVSEAPKLSNLNLVFTVIMDSFDVVEEYVQTAALEFAPGLEAVLDSAAPPPLAFFKGLPLITGFCWAVYALTLEKPGCRPKVYVGKSTNEDRGAIARMADYDKLITLPQYVKAALDDGYTITHKGFLCVKQRPNPSQYAVVEAVILALEATFSFFFWAMHSRVADYKMSHARGWDLDAFEYDGCCSHNAMMEGLAWTEITSEQAMRLAAQRKARIRDEDTRKLAKAKATKRFHCSTCNRSFNTRNQLERHNGVPYHTNRVKGLKIRKTPQAKHQAKMLRLKKFYCALCDHADPDKTKHTRHLNTDKHKFAVIAANKAAAEAAGSSS